MITLRRDGTPHTVRVGIGLHGDKLWSSGTESRVRTKHLRRDPRCSLFVFESEPGSWRWMSLERTVAIIDGPEAPGMHWDFFRELQAQSGPPDGDTVAWFGRQVKEEEFLQIMRDERRLIYEFTPQRTYGMFGGMPAA
jgi:hypothetical protein